MGNSVTSSITSVNHSLSSDLSSGHYLHSYHIPSSSTSSCSDVALSRSDLVLNDYLHSCHISSSTSTSCFDLAQDCLTELKNAYFDWRDMFEFLKAEMLLLKTFSLYVRRCNRKRMRNLEAVSKHEQEENKGDFMSESTRRSNICFRIQELVAKIIHDLQSAHLGDRHPPKSMDILKCALLRSRENVVLFLETDIKGQCISFLFDYHSPRDPHLVVDLIRSLSITLEVFSEKQKLLILASNLIGFATVRGVELMELIDFLSYIEEAASYLIENCRFDRGKKGPEFHEILRLIDGKFNPLDSHVREIYIRVLTASKQSRSSYALVPEGTKYAADNFVDSLADYLKDLLISYASFPDLVKDQILKLYQGVRFLGCLSKKRGFHNILHLEKELGVEMVDLIVAVVCDAGSLIFSLHVDELKIGFLEETHLALAKLVKVFMYIMAELAHIYSPVLPSSSFSFPGTNELGSMDFFLENLREVARPDKFNDSIAFPVDKIQTVQEDLKFLRSFLEKTKEQRNQNEKLRDFWSRVMNVAYKAELAIDSVIVGYELDHCLAGIASEINFMKIEAQELNGSIKYDDHKKKVTKTFTRMPSQVTHSIYNEDLVDLEDEVKTITERLTRGSKQLEVVPIVGMPGLGKTTLANKVYSSPSVTTHFHVRTWCCVSQTYSKQNLFLQIFHSIDSGSSNQYSDVDEDALAEKLRKALLRNKFLLVLDDMWDVEAWYLLEKSLPDNSNGSRVLLTSRFHDLSLQFRPDNKPHCLRQLTNKECRKLLQKKLIGKLGCLPTLSEDGFHAIAKFCSGLPLTVVLLSGILATTAQTSWEEVGRSLNSSIILNNDNCRKTVELSYTHLPDYLKPCLLYFSAFKEDENIQVRQLLWLWISEGLVQKTGGKSLEESAEDNLMALISRSLVMITEQRTTGGAKACRLHDLVHEFCVEKAKEENFLHIIHSSKDHIGLSRQSNPHRICDHNIKLLNSWESLFPNLRCFRLLDIYTLTPKDGNLAVLLPKLLRVLDLGHLRFHEFFPVEVVLLVHLRYLALRLATKFIPSAISNFSRLETLIVRVPSYDILLPMTI